MRPSRRLRRSPLRPARGHSRRPGAAMPAVPAPFARGYRIEAPPAAARAVFRLGYLVSLSALLLAACFIADRRAHGPTTALLSRIITEQL